MTSLLDRPVWSALTSRHGHLSTGDTLAKRFLKDVSPFAATASEDVESLAAMANLVERQTPEDQIFLMQVPPYRFPDELQAPMEAKGVQLVKKRNAASVVTRSDILPLTEENRDEMASLADLTKPGPFLKRTPEMGQFWGVFIDGRLAAMAGQRLSMPGFTEVSGVCTHPDFRGQGLAASLSDFVAQTIMQKGDTPFLHAWADNDGAIRLYQRLGFDIRAEVNVCILNRAES